MTIGTSQATWAKPSPYVLDVIRKSPEDDAVVRLRNKVTGRILWTRKNLFYYRQPNWTKDHRAVAVEALDSLAGGAKIFIWREGYRLREVVAPPNRWHYDYSMGCVWSPDKRRLLVRFGGSGDGDLDIGHLFSLKLGRGKFYKYTGLPSYPLVRKAVWCDNRTVLYWPTEDPYNGKIVKKPRVWRVP